MNRRIFYTFIVLCATAPLLHGSSANDNYERQIADVITKLNIPAGYELTDSEKKSCAIAIIQKKIPTYDVLEDAIFALRSNAFMFNDPTIIPSPRSLLCTALLQQKRLDKQACTESPGVIRFSEKMARLEWLFDRAWPRSASLTAKACNSRR